MSTPVSSSVCAVLASAAFALLSPATSPAGGSASLTVNAGQKLGQVPRLVFGQNIESADNKGIFEPTTDLWLLQTAKGHWDPVNRVPVAEVVEHARDLGMSALRYPGGCLTHNFDWRMAAGPVDERGDWMFGIDEWIKLCRAIGAEPMMTVSAYVLPLEEMPAHAAGLVEYLNAPATPEHPWAMKRAAGGHPEPYGVRWFELGNESDHGNHSVIPQRKFTPQEYATYARTTAAAMRQVDPTIQIGVIMVPGDATDVYSSWNTTVMREAGESADFVVIHIYSPNSPKMLRRGLEREFMQGCMAAPEQVEHQIQSYHRMIREMCGRDLPLAVTEYNSLAPDYHEDHGNQLLPFRFTYGAALESADLLRVFLKPESRVFSAHYWQYFNGYFGLLRKPRDATSYEKKPMYHLYRLWTQHLGAELVSAIVDSPRATFAGMAMTARAEGDQYIPSVRLGELDFWPHADFSDFDANGLSARREGDTYVIQLDKFSGEAYPAMATLPATQFGEDGGYDFDVSFEARFIPEAGSFIAPLGARIADGRGFNRTPQGQQQSLSSMATEVNGVTSPEWRTFRTYCEGLIDSRGVQIQAQLETLGHEVSGRLEFRHFKVEVYSQDQFPAYSLVTSTATLSEDGNTLYVVVFNKSADDAIDLTINLEDFPADSAKEWQVTGPSLLSTDGVGETTTARPLTLTGASLTHTLPPRSMTALEFYRQR